MGSVSDLINLATFDINQRQASLDRSPMQRSGQLADKLSQVLKQMNDQRRAKENQQRLSHYIQKNIGGLEPEIKVTETGGISYTLKPRKEESPDKKIKREFADDTKKAMQSVSAGSAPQKEIAILTEKYPGKSLATIEKNLQRISTGKTMQAPIQKQPIKKVGFHQFIARSKPGYAAMNEATQITSEDIKTYGDLEALVENQDILKERGVNVEALLEYYDAELSELSKKGLLK